jgi:Tol biopolymer transport system component
VDGATARPLLSDADTLRCPFSGRAAWSPDGKRLALVCTEADGETSRALVTVSREGTVLTEALPSPLLHGAPSWLGDDRLVVSMADETDGPLRIVEVPAEGGDPRDLTQGTGGSDSAVDWSPSGLLFLRVPIGTREGGDVWMLDPAGQEVRLTTSGGIRMPTWGPERGRFAFLRGADGVRGDQRLWIKHVGEAETGLAVTGVIGYPAWGPR